MPYHDLQQAVTTNCHEEHYPNFLKQISVSDIFNHYFKHGHITNFLHCKIMTSKNEDDIEGIIKIINILPPKIISTINLLDNKQKKINSNHQKIYELLDSDNAAESFICNRKTGKEILKMFVDKVHAVSNNELKDIREKYEEYQEKTKNDLDKKIQIKIGLQE